MAIITKRIKVFFSSMRWTMMATYIAVIMITLVLMSIYILGVLSDNLYEKEEINLFAKANIMSDSIASYVSIENTSAIEEYTNRLLTGTNIRGLVVNPTYNVLFDSNNELTGKALMREIIQTASLGEQAHTVMKSELDINMMTVAVPVRQKDNNNVIGVVYLVEAMTDIDETIGYVKVNMLTVSALISILVGFLSFGMSYIVTSPVDEITSAAKEISKGNFDCRVPVKGHNEFANLASTINFMCSELGNLEDNRKKFISDASHELKTPLATIKLISDSVISTDNPDPEMTREFLSDLSDEVDRLTRIIERLLTLTKLDSGKSMPRFEPVDITILLNSIVKKLTTNAKAKDIVLYTDYKLENPAPIVLDYDKIWESVYNLTDNAIKYTDEGGYVKLGISKEGKNLLIQIEDNGHGIPSDELDHIFERFYRLDDSRARETGGTGLGLAIAKESVLLHGGRIDVTSEIDVGSTFTIYLPYNTESESGQI